MNAIRLLQQRYGSGEARALYELMLWRRFGLSRTDILLGKDTTLSAKDKAELQIIVGRVAKGEPVQYVLGSEEFCGRDFLVTPDVLIPRPETQQLVRLVEQHVAPGSSIIDIGTGSGCIAITLALAGYRVSALDISRDALAVARKNAERLGAEVEFVEGDIKTLSLPLPLREMSTCSSPTMWRWRGNAIVSNPPYVCEKEASAMDDNVLLHEPHLALFVPDDNPLLFYRAIADFGRENLANDGHIFFEINCAYSQQIKELLLQKGYKDVNITEDQYGKERFVAGRFTRESQKNTVIPYQ